MGQYAVPALLSLFLWWFTTGVVLYLDGLPRHTFRWTMVGASVTLVVALFGLASSSSDITVGGAYMAFVYGLLAWAWLEVSFYTGIVTGPPPHPCKLGCSGWPHFLHAVQASLYHELAILALAAIVVAVTWGGANQFGTWTFVILWWMHQSARLNVFLGVPNITEEFLPEHMQFLRRFLTRKPMNMLFPFSITVSTVIAVFLVQQAMQSGSEFEATGYGFLAAMMALAILEHWFLVLPLPAAGLWRWSLRSRKPPAEAEAVAGFLGAGETRREHL